MSANGVSLSRDGAARRPWRAVVHIADHVGDRGGESWCLTLECGHSKAVRKPVFREWHVLRETKTAPHRVRCLFCPTEPRQPNF